MFNSSRLVNHKLINVKYKCSAANRVMFFQQRKLKRAIQINFRHQTLKASAFTSS